MGKKKGMGRQNFHFPQIPANVLERNHYLRMGLLRTTTSVGERKSGKRREGPILAVTNEDSMGLYPKDKALLCHLLELGLWMGQRGVRGEIGHFYLFTLREIRNNWKEE